MSPELSKKERTAQKRQALTGELYTLFVRSYEMDRAWKMPQRKAFDNAFSVMNRRVDELIKQRPQETSFIIGCRGEAKEAAIQRVMALEGHGQQNEKPSGANNYKKV